MPTIKYINVLKSSQCHKHVLLDAKQDNICFGRSLRNVVLDTKCSWMEGFQVETFHTGCAGNHLVSVSGQHHFLFV